MDVLSDVLSSVRLSGSVLFTAEFGAPFGVSSPPSEQYAHLLVPSARRLILFHLVTAGTAFARCEGGAPVEIRSGDMLLLPYGSALELGSGGTNAAPSIFELVPPLPWSQPPRVSAGGDGPRVRMVCGFLHAEELLLQPLLADLPGLLVIREDEATPQLRALQTYMLAEIEADRAGRASMIRRLVELLFVEGLRYGLAARFEGPAPPIASLNDPLVGKALVALHTEPARDWTVDSLARHCAASRSLLADRFARLVGCPPMEYLTRWRMQVAARRMLDLPAPLSEIASSVGYDSDHGFNRTFRRYFGEPPARWRKQHRLQVSAGTSS